MDMWCPYGIGREIWDREVLRIVCSPFPLEGEISLAGAFPFAVVGGSARRRIIVEYIIISIIIIVGAVA